MIGLGVPSGGVIKVARLGDLGTNGDGMQKVPGLVPGGGVRGISDGTGEGV